MRGSIPTPDQIKPTLVLARSSVASDVVHPIHKPNNLTDKPFKHQRIQITEWKRGWGDDWRR
jgi:hypothetical protein